MLLFRHIHNEALDEDRKAQREVIARTQKQVALFSSEEAVETSLTRNQLNELKGKILQFANALNYATNEVQKSEEIGKSMTILQEKYDNMALYIASIPLSSVIGPEQKNITDYLDSFIPQIQSLVGLLGANINVTVMEKEVGSEILSQFNDQTYLPIGGINISETLGEEGDAGINNSQIITDIIASITGDLENLNTILTDARLGPRGTPKLKASALKNSLTKILDKLQERLDEGDYVSEQAIKAVNKLSDQYTAKIDALQTIMGQYQSVISSLGEGGAPEELNVAV